MRTERNVMIAAIRSNPECSASESTPRLPVRTTRKAFRETRSVAEPTLNRAARFFSRASSSGAAGVSIEELDYRRMATFPEPAEAGCGRQQGSKTLARTTISMRSWAAEVTEEAAWLRRVHRGPLALQKAMRAPQGRLAGRSARSQMHREQCLRSHSL